MVNYLWLDPVTGDTAVRANAPQGWAHVCYYYTNDSPALIISTIPSIKYWVESHQSNSIAPSGIIGNKISLTLQGTEEVIAFWAVKLLNCPLMDIQVGKNLIMIK